MFSTPVVSGEVLYVGSCSGNFYALDKYSGDLLWRHDVKPDGGLNFHGDPVVAGEWILIGTDGPGAGPVYAFDRATGKQVWRYDPPCPEGGAVCGIHTDLVMSGDRFFGASFADELFAIQIKDGGVAWTFRGPEIPRESQGGTGWNLGPAVAGKRIFWAAQDGTVYALDAQSGAPLWDRHLGAPTTTSVVLSGDAVFTAAKDGWFYRLHAQNGEILARIRIEGVPGRKIVTTGTEILLYENWLRDGGALLCLAGSLAERRWRVPVTGGAKWSSPRPYVWDGKVLAGNSAGKVFAYQLMDGRLLWHRQLEGEIKGIGVDEGILYVGTLQGTIYALVPQ